MKKLLIAAACIVAGTGVLKSSTNHVTAKPIAAAIAQSQVSYRKDIGTAD